MTREEKRRYLSAYVELKREIEVLAEEKGYWKEEEISIPISRIEATGIRGHSHVDPVVEHLDISNLLNKKQEEAKEKMIEIMNVIDNVKDSQQRTALRYKYINGKYTYEIANLMSYTLDGMFKLLARAVDSIEIGQ